MYLKQLGPDMCETTNKKSSASPYLNNKNITKSLSFGYDTPGCFPDSSRLTDTRAMHLAETPFGREYYQVLSDLEICLYLALISENKITC